MSLNSTENRRAYATNGITTHFPFNLYFLSVKDLVVVLKNNTTGIEATLTIDTHYTVTGAGKSTGGDVIMGVAPLAGFTLSIYRDVSRTQDIDLVENDPIPAEVIEGGFDKLTMMALRDKERIDRSVRLSEGFVGNFDPALPAVLLPFTTVRVNAAGTGFETGPSTEDIDEANASALAAAQSATEAAASAASAYSHEATATAAAGAASESATSAADSAAFADASADAAAVSEINAHASELAAEASKNSATTSATTATDKATIATDKAAIAVTQADIATTKASQAATSATNASASASNASTSEVNAAASAAANLTALSNNTKYFGEPNTDGSWRIMNDNGNLLFQTRIAGAWITTSELNP